MTKRPWMTDVELPTTKGQKVQFWLDDDPWWIVADQDTAWTLVMRGNHWGQFVRSGDGYAEIDEVDGRHDESIPEWRTLVRRILAL